MKPRPRIGFSALRVVMILLVALSSLVLLWEVRNFNTRTHTNTPAPIAVEEHEWEPLMTAILDKDETRKILQPDRCFHIRNIKCETATWSIFGDRLAVGGPPLSIRPIPSRSSNTSISLQLCSDNTRFISQTGCILGVTSKTQTPYTLRKGYYGEENIRLEITNWPFHIVTTENGFLTVTGDDELTDKEERRREGEWVLIPATTTTTEFDEDVNTITLERNPSMMPMKDTFDKVPCDRSFHGCCNPLKKPGFEQPKTPLKGPQYSTQITATAVIVSSSVTLPQRVPIVVSWLRSSLFTNKIISLDCGVKRNVKSKFKDEYATFLIGPQGPPVPGMSEVTLRVPMVLHWCFHNTPSDWYFMVDDDTLVFPENMKWVISHLPDPRATPLYIGHTSEWLEKTRYHGDMAFGGGGSLVSKKSGEIWKTLFDDVEPKNAAMKWLKSGRCSHSGGDGSFCRCLDWAMESSSDTTASTGHFIDWKGFHQFDIVGTGNILKIIKCPRCPDPTDLTLLWICDVVGSQPVITLHHLLAIKTGSIYPGANGTETASILMKSYEGLPPSAFLRRVCGRDAEGRFTLCVNLGLSLQIFPPEVTPVAALALLVKQSPSAGADPQEKLTAVAVLPHVSRLMCTMFFSSSIDDVHKQSYKGLPGVHPRPKYSAECIGTSEVEIQAAAKTMTAKITFQGSTVTWVEDLSHIV
eukprot:TRINITY_DN9558_c0_g1_i1.p1 TRINITY_DN9558_c0_g1~~TRINITY_DN9558_c0_g1_i1.p1  ORF type:complete len:695 (+),score=48.62 TRINITY_DN9558_c0_g1_i1:84-2168(+)